MIVCTSEKENRIKLSMRNTTDELKRCLQPGEPFEEWRCFWNSQGGNIQPGKCHCQSCLLPENLLRWHWLWKLPKWRLQVLLLVWATTGQSKLYPSICEGIRFSQEVIQFTSSGLPIFTDPKNFRDYGWGVSGTVPESFDDPSEIAQLGFCLNLKRAHSSLKVELAIPLFITTVLFLLPPLFGSVKVQVN